MRHRFENWVNGLNGDWCVSRQRFFGVPFPVWYPVATATGPSTTTRPIRAGRIAPADRSVDRRAGRLHAPTSAVPPDGFVGDPDVMDTWATSSLTPQIAGGWLDGSGSLRARRSRWTCVRRRTTSSARGCSTTVLRCAPRARLAAVDERGDLRLGARSRSQEDVEVEGQRRHADGAARGARLRRRALLGGERAAGRATRRSTSRADEGRPAAGDQAAERVEVRAAAAGAARADHRAARSRHAHELARLVGEATEHLEAVRLRARARADRTLLLVVLRRLPRAREGAPVRRSGPRARRRPTARCSSRCRRCCGCSRRSCRSSPRRSGRGGSPGRCTRRRGRRPTKWSRRSAAHDADARRRVRVRRQAALAEVRRIRALAKKPAQGRHRARASCRRRSSRLRLPRGTSRLRCTSRNWCSATSRRPN